MFIFFGREGTSAVSLDRDTFLAVVEDSYSAYYTIHRNEDQTELPLAFRADYYSRDEKYWFTKSVTIWANETNELCYVFCAPHFDAGTVERCLDFVIEDAVPRVKPHKEHQYTNFKAVFLADSYDEAAKTAVKKRKYTKNYNHSLHGYSMLLAAAVDLSDQSTVTNKAGYPLVKYFRKLFDARK